MSEDISSKFKEQIKASNIESGFGIEFIDVFLACTVSEECKPLFEQYIKNRVQYEAAKAGLVGQPDILNPAAVPASAPAEWTCPACQAKNNGGNFCEYCGTPRNK